MIWTKEQTKALTDRVLSFSKAEQTFVAVNGSERANLRFARNTATTSGASSGTSLAITVELRQAVGHGHDVAVRRRQPAARAAERRGDRQGLAGESRGDAVPRAADLLARQRVLRRCGEGVARLARVVGRDGDRAEQEEGRRVGGLRRDAGGDAGGRQLAGTVRLRPVHRRRLQPDRAHAGRLGVGLGVEVVQRAAAARAGGARRDGDRQGGAGEEPGRRSSPASTPSSSSRRRSPTCSSSCCSRPTRARPTRAAASSRRRAAATASASRSSATRSASTPTRRIRSRRRISLRQRGPADREKRLGRERRAEGPLLLAVLGGEDGQEADRRARPT